MWSQITHCHSALLFKQTKLVHTLTPQLHFCCVTYVAVPQGCDVSHTQFWSRYECLTSTLHFHKLLSVNLLCVFSAEVCDFGHL